MTERCKKIIKDLVIVAIIIVAIILTGIIVVKAMKPIYVEKEKVGAVLVECINGAAEINAEKEIENVINLVNDISAMKRSELIYGEMNQRTPDAQITFYAKDGKVLQSIYFYGDNIWYNNTSYITLGSANVVYDKISELCK